MHIFGHVILIGMLRLYCKNIYLPELFSMMMTLRLVKAIKDTGNTKMKWN